MESDEIKKYINNDRRDFDGLGFDKDQVDSDPLVQFSIWMMEAKAAEVKDPYATCLATVDANGYPQSRMVYLRDIIDEEFVFYTNYNSAKGKDLAKNEKASLNFHWAAQHRQVRITGDVKPVSAEVSDIYFASRPRASQLGAWASAQSTVLQSRQELEAALAEVTSRFEGQDVPRPPHWGGYAIKPQEIEFWQGRPSRLHDRLVYVSAKEEWSLARLAP